MIDALRDDELSKKVGGPFRLTALIQRRLKELIEGARPLVDTEGKTLFEVAVAEVNEDKIAIDYEKSVTKFTFEGPFNETPEKTTKSSS